MTNIRPTDRNMMIWLNGWCLVFLAFHLAIGPDELHRSHILLGRSLLFGESAPNPAHPMFGYAIVIAALGAWTPVFNTAIGWAGFVLVYRWLDLGRAPASVLFYIATLAYAGMITSWNDHAPWLGLIMLSLAVLHRYGERGFGAGAITGLLWGLAYNIRPEALLLFPLFLVIHILLEAFGFTAWRLRAHAGAFAAFLLCMVPWGIYTTQTLGKYTPGTTHSWSVAYYSLGIVPDNEYGIVAQDEWLYDKAAEIGESTPWSQRANEHFRAEYNRIISSDPAFLLRRIGWGLFVFATSGVYVPDFRLLEGRAPETNLRLRYATRDLAHALGMPRFMMSAAMRDLPELAPTEPTTWDMVLVGSYVVLGIVLRLALVIALLQSVLLLIRPLTLLSQGTILALSASTLALTLFVTAVFLPTTRMSTVPLVFTTLLAQSVRCDRRLRASDPNSMPQDRATVI